MREEMACDPNYLSPPPRISLLLSFFLPPPRSSIASTLPYCLTSLCCSTIIIAIFIKSSSASVLLSHLHFSHIKDLTCADPFTLSSSLIRSNHQNQLSLPHEPPCLNFDLRWRHHRSCSDFMSPWCYDWWFHDLWLYDFMIYDVMMLRRHEVTKLWCGEFPLFRLYDVMMLRSYGLYDLTNFLCYEVMTWRVSFAMILRLDEFLLLWSYDLTKWRISFAIIYELRSYEVTNFLCYELRIYDLRNYDLRSHEVTMLRSYESPLSWVTKLRSYEVMIWWDDELTTRWLDDSVTTDFPSAHLPESLPDPSRSQMTNIFDRALHESTPDYLAPRLMVAKSFQTSGQWNERVPSAWYWHLDRVLRYPDPRLPGPEAHGGWISFKIMLVKWERNLDLVLTMI